MLLTDFTLTAGGNQKRKMADTLPHPTMDWSNPDQPQAFKEFKQMAEIWFRIKGTEAVEKHSYIILWSGREGLRMYNTWALMEYHMAKIF